MAEPIKDDDDAFANAFAEFAAPDGVVKPPAVPAEPVVPAEPEVAAEPAIEPVSDALDAAAEAARKVVGKSSAQIAADDEAARLTAPSVAPATTESILERLASALEKPSAPVPAAPQVQPDVPYTADELEVLTSYEKDWPDVSRAEMLKRREEYRQITQYIFNQIAPALQTLSEQQRVLATRAQIEDLHAVVEDYDDDMRTKVVEWVGKQPAYLKPAYEYVVQRGTADEVADLIQRWRAASGATPAARVAPVSAVPAADPASLTPAAKKAAAALAPVKSQRSGIQQGLDPNNFEDAFARFAETMDKS
jgi:hypothetical protein